MENLDTYGGYRRTGRTYRLLLRAIAQATEKPGQEIMVMMTSRPAIENALMQARAICIPLQSFAVVSHTQHTVSFLNGSRLYFSTPEQEDRHRGRQFVSVHRDLT